MTGDDMMIALYDDGDPERPNEAGIDRALACVLEAMLKLRGREHVAQFLDLAADRIRDGDFGQPLEPERPVCH